MNMVAYCRVSTDKEDQLNSLETQKKFFEEFAEKNGHTLIHIYADEGISGTKLKKRKEFLQLMKDSENGLFELVAVKDISRFARNALDFLQATRQLKSRGILCNFVNTNLTTTDSEMILVTLAAVAQEESANTSKRIKFSKKMNAEKGKVPNIVYGYDKTIGDYFNLNINPFEADIIRRIYEMYITDGYGAGKIAKILNGEGIKTKRNCNWSQNAVSRILTNPLYTGKIINGKEEIKDFLTSERTRKDKSEWLVCDRPDLVIINQATFDKAQKILNANKEKFHVTSQRNSSKYVFSTLLKCTDCGHSFRRISRTYKNTYITWSCCGRNSNGVESCSNTTTISESELLNSIKAYFAEMIKDKQSVIKKVVADFNKNYKSNDENLKTEKDLLSDIQTLKKKRQKYMDMFENDIISMEDLKGETENINLSIKRLEDKLKMVRYNISQGDKLESSLIGTFNSIDDILNSAEITNEMLKRVIDRIEVDETGKVDIYLKLFTEIGLDNTYRFSDNRT